jgi:hypothetical protein
MLLGGGSLGGIVAQEVKRKRETAIRRTAEKLWEVVEDFMALSVDLHRVCVGCHHLCRNKHYP